jgi:hypothetical protein
VTPFANVIRSGVNPSRSEPNQCPSRPNAQMTSWRHEGAAGVLHGLEDDHADVLGPLGQDRLLDRICGGQRVVARVLARVRVEHVAGVGHERLEGSLGGRDARDREGSERAAVVGAVTRDDDPARALAERVEVLARQLPGGLHGLGAARGEEHARHLRRREREHALGQRERRRVGRRPVRVVREALHLGRGRGADLGPVRVADLRREEAGHRVQQARAVGLDDIRPIAPDEHGRSFALDVRHLRPRQPLMAGRALDVECSQRAFDLAHARPFS